MRLKQEYVTYEGSGQLANETKEIERKQQCLVFIFATSAIRNCTFYDISNR